MRRRPAQPPLRSEGRLCCASDDPLAGTSVCSLSNAAVTRRYGRRSHRCSGPGIRLPHRSRRSLRFRRRHRGGAGSGLGLRRCRGRGGDRRAQARGVAGRGGEGAGGAGGNGGAATTGRGGNGGNGGTPGAGGNGGNGAAGTALNRNGGDGGDVAPSVSSNASFNRFLFFSMQTLDFTKDYRNETLFFDLLCLRSGS